MLIVTMAAAKANPTSLRMTRAKIHVLSDSPSRSLATFGPDISDDVVEKNA
jgi:hypothetical protein